MRSLCTRVIICIVMMCAVHSYADSINLMDPTALVTTLQNNDVIINAYQDRGDPLSARSELSFDPKSGVLKSLIEKSTEVSAELKKEEIDSNLKTPDENIASLEASVNNSSTTEGVVGLAAPVSSTGERNLGLSSQGTSNPSLNKSFSAASILSGASLASTPSVSGLNIGSIPSSSFLKGVGSSGADNYASLTRQGIDAVEKGEPSVNKGSSSNRDTGSQLSLASRPDSSASVQAPSNSTETNSSSASPSDIAAFSDAFYGYGPPTPSYEGLNSGGNGSGVSSQTSVASLDTHQNKTSSKGVPSTDTKDSSAKPVNCQAAKEDFYANFNNTSSYTEEKIVTDKDGKPRTQYCIKPQKDDLNDVYSALGSLEASCPQEVGALFYGSDAESACVWVDDPPAGHHVDDLFTNKSAEDNGTSPVSSAAHKEPNKP